MMNRIIIFCMLILAGLASFAIPAKNVTRNITLNNGSTVSVKLIGDEYGHYWLSADGTAYRQVEEDIYEEINPTLLNEVRRSKMQTSNVRRLNKSSLHTIDHQHKYEGEKNGIVILVNFSDLSMKAANTRDAIDDQFNKVGYNKNDHVGSVHDYFYDQSYGAFNLKFDVVGPFKLSKSYTYYGKNDSYGDDMYPQEMVIEACKMAAANGTDFSKYDWDGDGEVDQIYIIYAGYGEHAGAPSSTIWPHEWELSATNKSFSLNGTKIDTYACSCELMGTSGSKMSGIGTACHEFSHCLGLPDFYDTSYNGGFGMNAWDLMDSGSYNGPSENGEIPCGYSAYERWVSGWLTPLELNEPCNVQDIPNLENSPVAYIIYNDNNINEYFIIENRQPQKWFRYVNNYTDIGGLLIYHVDYNPQEWNNNNVNNSANHQRMTIIPSGKSYGTYYSYYGQYSVPQSVYKSMLFPGSKNVTVLDNDSHYSYGAKLYNKNLDGSYYMNKPITDIISNQGLLNFKFKGGKVITAPTAYPAKDVTSDGFVASWETIDDAFEYKVRLIINDPNTKNDPSECLLLTEDFKNFLSPSDGSADLSSILDQYTSTTGWTGAKIYKGIYGAKLATSTVNGYIVTPFLKPQSNVVTIQYTMRKWKTDSSKYILSCISNSQTTKISTETLSSEDITYTQHINVNDSFKIMLESASISKQRGYLSYLAVYDGNFSENELAEDKSKIQKVKHDIEYNTKETSYVFSDLNPNYKYSYQVCAVNSNGDQSDWSNVVEVDLLNTQVEDLTNSTSNSSCIYDLNGMKVTTPIKKGIYIINGKKFYR